ncbi:helix-turn-helix transcriptional regulator [Amycolatopsis alba]|uniref:Helix-turn-helix transcriptional regulator n=1 Tax=Amycolatopsis alba DSM 44262 TaxID=1125972 RepID=A0A229RER0_AMYAL|nr:LuxR C-terminal-related transcriptional regulator [Amycolatopsis alba]OXM45140.1 helix-turn-helix transcriptional regulator [Amycolatopsis alba DSM 44262]
MVSYLGSCADMEVVDGSRHDEADVVIAAFESLSAAAITALRRSAGKPIVLMVDRIRESELPVAAECRVVALLPRAAVAGKQLPDAVRFAAGLPSKPLGTLIEQAERFDRDYLRTPEPAATNLSERETEVLRLMADGLDTNAIAAALSYSERTVKNIIYAMTSRLKLRNRSHAVAYALRTGAI